MLLCVFACCLVIAPHARGASLFGKVIEVNSGDTITISNLNRPVRVKLLGVDAPEMNQAFGEVAKKHLSDLVYDKSVLVEYSGIAADSSLNGRVLLNNADIGAQMIRDGAAWFDPNNENRLTVNDRDVYQQSEQAARSERRGLWQGENPVAPWDFVKAQVQARIPVRTASDAPDTKPKRSGPTPELTNLTLMMSKMNPAGSTPAGTDKALEDFAWATSTTRKNWSQFQAPDEDFSVFIPEQGKRVTASTPYEGGTVAINTYMVRDGWAFYSLVWFSGLTNGEKDENALNTSVDRFLKGAAEGYQQSTGQDFNCKPRGRKNISQNGYTGFEYDLSTCTYPTYMRMYTRVTGNMRTLYVATVVYGEEDENVMRFLKSFTIKSRSTAH